MVEWKITNIIFSIKFNTIFSVDRMAEILSENRVPIDYDPDSFPALFITLEDNGKGKRKKITVFRTGVINVYGLKKVEEIYDVIDKIKEIFNKNGISIPDTYEIKFNNLVIAGKFDYTNIKIEKIYYDLDDANYDPERFPAVTIPYYISKDYKVVFNIFRDGTFICAGIKGDFNNIYQHIDEVVNSFQENVIKKYVK